MCFLGGANLDILKKCPTEKNGFIAIGIGIVDMALISVLAMYFILTSTIIKNFNTGLIILISLFYGFVIFIGYWGIISVIRKRVKYPFFISMFSFFAISIMSIVLAFAINKIILKIDYSVNLSARSYISIVFCILFSSVIYLIPLILKILINASPYEEEKERLEFNFISQKEADVMAYREKYQGYARYFNDSAIKMESIKQLGDISKEYHMYMENIQNETFDFINKLDKMNQSTNGLLEECKKNAEEQFKITIDKISKIFGSI
jgi:hypothetical protein